MPEYVAELLEAIDEAAPTLQKMSEEQRYRDPPWEELIALWRNFNLRIARIMDLVPKDERVRPRARHNLDELAWRPIPRDEPATLDCFMSDYVAHL